MNTTQKQTKDERRIELLDSLSDDQLRAFNEVNNGHSVCITGKGGTGKSYLLDVIQELLGCTVTASTGIAALNVGGATIHSWSGLGIGRISGERLVAIMRNKARQYNDGTLDRLKNVKRLAIDEISMLEGDFVEKLDELLRIVRENDSPFGGTQMLFLGDFLQLPPIKHNGIPRFAFETQPWKDLGVKVCMLNKCFRQKDQEFADLLDDIRNGNVTSEVVSYLNSRFIAIDPDPAHPGLIIHTHNAGCDQINAEGLSQTDGKEQVYTARDTCVHESFAAQLDKNCLASKSLTLREGCRVMLLKNLDTYGGLVNGSMGTIERVHRSEVHVKFDGKDYSTEIVGAEWEITDGDDILATRKQIPLRLGYAVTVHKSQGMSLNKLYAHLDKCFSPGQAYVALSRATTPEGIFLRGSANLNIMANSRAVDFYTNNT